MDRDEIQITLTEDEIEKLKPSEEADVGPLTSNKPIDEIQITLTEDGSEKLKPSEEADVGSLPSNKPLDEIQIKLTEEIKKLKLLEEVALTSNKPLIQEVTSNLRSCYSEGECKRYFKPISVAIGPLNHQKKTKRDLRFERGEEWKVRLAAIFINLSDGTEQDFYKNVKEEIDGLRKCYNFKEGQKWTDEELAWMFVVDGCALLLFIILDVNDQWKEFRVGIERVDFFLLENQLPYQLLKILVDSFDTASTENNLKESFKKLITKFIDRTFLSLIGQQQHQSQVDHSQPHLSDEQQEEKEEEQEEEEEEEQQEEEKEEQQQQQQEDPVHLLDLLRRRLMGVKSNEKGEKQQRMDKYGLRNTILKGYKSKHCLPIRNVKVLKDKGILFKAREKVDTITEIDFNDHCCMPTLTLAPIFLHNTTMPLLLNLMAYELCPDFDEDCTITSHLSFLDSLIDNGEDVKDLRDAGVLHNGLGSDEAVAKLFNKISRILVSNLKIDSELTLNIHEYCDNKSHFSSLRASIQNKLTHTYFRSPWSIFVFLGALAGLIMTGMQTYKSFHENRLP